MEIFSKTSDRIIWQFMGNIDYTYDDFQAGIKTLVDQIDQTNHKYDYIIGLNRGGLIPAVTLSHQLSIPMLALNWQTRDSNLRNIPDNIKNLIGDKNILIVDDIVDSGESISLLLRELNNICCCNIASLVYNSDQSIISDYYHTIIQRSIDNRWIDFFWEKTKEI